MPPLSYDAKRHRRAEFEIIIDVLSECNTTKLTHIMYRSNTNCRVLRGAIDKMIAANLIMAVAMKGKKHVYYARTPLGNDILKAWMEFKKYADVINSVSLYSDGAFGDGQIKM